MNPKIVIFGENEAVSATYNGAGTTWDSIPLSASKSIDINLDSKNKTLIYEDSDSVKELTLEGLSPTGQSIENIEALSSIQIDSLTGDVYMLKDSVETPSGRPFWGGSIYRQKPLGTIRYTTDGSEPSEASKAYSGAFTLSETTYVKAKTFTGLATNSPVASANFVITPYSAETPVIFADKTTDPTSILVFLNCSTPDSVIRYTKNGTTPTNLSTLYTAPFTINSSSNVKAKAFAAGYSDSLVSSASFTIVPPTALLTATPEITAAGGGTSIEQDTLISMTCSTPSSTIRYTTDGSEPTAFSKEYTSPILVVDSQEIDSVIVRAKAFSSSLKESSTKSVTFTVSVFTFPADTPVISPNGGNYSNEALVSMSCSTPGASIRFTTTGEDPSSSSQLYTSPFFIYSSSTIKARAFAIGYLESGIVSANFVITSLTAPTPTISPIGGSHKGFVQVVMSAKNTTSQPTLLKIQNLNLFKPQDMKIDSPRRILWIADTGNNRLVAININTLTVLKTYEFDGLISCCGISINQVNGALISRWFDSQTLEERIVFIYDGDIRVYSSFSDFPWGDFSHQERDGDLLLIESKSRENGIYKLSADGNSLTMAARSNNRIPVKISIEPIYGMIEILHADGALTGYSNEMEYLGQVNYPSDPKRILFPSFYGLSHWVGNYRFSKKAHLLESSRVEPSLKSVLKKALPLKDLENGVCSFSDMRPVFLRKSGKRLTTVSRDGKTILQDTILSSSYDLIAQNAINGDILIGKKGSTVIRLYDKNHTIISEMAMPSGVVSIDSRTDGKAWVLLDDRKACLVDMSSYPYIVSSVSLPGYKKVMFIKHDMKTGGAWASSVDNICKISPSGNQIVFVKSGFGEITDIAPQNYLADIYNSTTPFTSSKSMSYDGVRNQAWWLSDPKKKLVGMINFNTNSGGTLKVHDLLVSSSSYSTETLTTSSSSSISSYSTSSSSSRSSLSSSSSKSTLSSSKSSTSSSSLSSLSSSTAAEDWVYTTIDSSNIRIDGYLGSNRDISIPSIINGVPVTSIAGSAFVSKNFTSVTLPDSIEMINISAFRNCNYLTSVNFGGGLKLIGIEAFKDCISLTGITFPPTLSAIFRGAFQNSGITSVTIPASTVLIEPLVFGGCLNLTEINVDPGNTSYVSVDDVLFDINQTKLVQFPAGIGGDYTMPSSVVEVFSGAFLHCALLTSIDISTSVNSIGHSAFYGCIGLTSLDIPTGVSRIQYSTFYGCSGLTSLTIPSSITSIEHSAFYNCSGLTSLAIPSGITAISDNTFYNCSGLTSLTIPSGVTSIGSYAFYNCIGLSSLSIPSGVISIGEYSFALLNITSFTIPEGVTVIGSLAFYQSKIISIYIPDSVTTIGDRAFSWCPNLIAIVVGALNPNYSDYNGVLYNKSKTRLIQCPGAKTGTHAIPSGVTQISDYAFYACILAEISTSIGPTTVGEYCFAEMPSLTSLVLSEGVTSIGQRAFLNCLGITSFSLPASVISIGEAALAGMNNLPAITVSPSNLNFSEDSGVLYNKTFTSLVQCPGGKTGTYNIVGTTTELLYASFYQSKLTAITLPIVLTTIRASVFHLSKITSITIPSAVTTIGTHALSNCPDLLAITVSPGNTYYSDVGGILFNYNQTTLIQFPKGRAPGGYSIPSSVLDIAANAFYSCGGVSSITFPYNTVNFVSSSSYSEDMDPSFSSQSSSEYGVKTIGNHAFWNCDGLVSVVIPSSVESLGTNCFDNCGALTSVIFNGNAPTLADTTAFLATTTKLYYYDWGTGFNSAWITKAGRPTFLISSLSSSSST